MSVGEMVRRDALVGAIGVVLAAGCVAAQSRPASLLVPGALDPARATTWELPANLREISGLAVVDGRLFAHNDERARIHELDPVGRRVVKSFTVGSRQGIKGDFEGIAAGEGRLFLVTSDGVIHEFEEGADGSQVPFHRTETGLGARCEIEGLAYQPEGRLLLLACKQMRPREARGSVVVLRWSIARRAVVDPPLRAPLPATATAFSASGIDRDPGSGNLLLVASQDGLIAELDDAGRLLAVQPLPRRAHRQPEGVAITPAALIVSDEGAKSGKASARLTIYARAAAAEAPRPR